MRLELGCPVHSSAGPFGELADVVVDPIRRRVTHFVVEPHHHHELARLVPAELAAADQAANAIVLRSTPSELERMPRVQDFAWVQFAEPALDDPDWDVGIETVLVQPQYEDDLGANVFGLDPHVALTFDRIPKGDVEIRRASTVVSADGYWLGHVEGFLVDPGRRITHLVLEHGHLFRRRDVTIPVEAITRIGNDRVDLELTKDDVGRLPAVAVRRPRAAPGPGGAEAEGLPPAA